MPNHEDEKAITSQQLDRVRDRLLQLYKDVRETTVAAKAGIPQPTLNAIVKQRKLGALTAKRLARYFNESVDELLNGTRSAGYYAVREEGLSVGYPKRGKVLDGLRHVLPAGVLEEAQTIVLPHGTREWTEVEWLGEVYAIANRWEKLHNPPEPPSSGPRVADGHPRKAQK